MTTNRDYSVNLSVQQVLSLWVQGTTLQHFTGKKGKRRTAGVCGRSGAALSCKQQIISFTGSPWASEVDGSSQLGWFWSVTSVGFSCESELLDKMVLRTSVSSASFTLSLRTSLIEMWYWVFLWCLFSSLFVHGAAGLLMLVTLQRHRRGRLITLVLVSVGFLASLSGSVITSAAVAGVYRVAGKDMAPLEALVFGVGQTTFSVIISFSRILATL
ncbi:Transmembrane protein 170B [Takifugu flavidus]|uniref:Transmembrane protein 170B n=1 Tax=Takifugu flavidus TaxID=433684 RepID=A0A5C6NFI3_9TELE|nr:Transmembrane protein 170B [Takifugu flavidus]